LWAAADFKVSSVHRGKEPLNRQGVGLKIPKNSKKLNKTLQIYREGRKDHDFGGIGVWNYKKVRLK